MEALLPGEQPQTRIAGAPLGDAVAFQRGLFQLAAAVGVGFLGLLRPAELMRLRLGDLVQPDMLLAREDNMLIRFGSRKTACDGADVGRQIAPSSTTCRR